jgi:ubiquinone/menaquinone biosynthesis C-methylase UbiE
MQLRASKSNPLYSIGRLPVLDVVTSVGLLGFDRRARAEAVGVLRIRSGERVLELACGTGRTLALLSRAVGNEGSVLAVDRSDALIARARRRIAGAGNVELIAGDWSKVEIGEPVDAALCVLGLSVIDRWEEALDRLLGALAPGGRLAIVDQFVDSSSAPWLNAYVRVCGWLAGAQPERPVIAAAQARLTGVTAYALPMGLRLIAGSNG